MTNNADAQIAREWAERAMKLDLPDDAPIEGYRAAARYILATTTPSTMADIDWDDEVHAGLVARHYDGDLVRMIGPDLDNEGTIICHWAYYGSPVTGRLLAENLTPLPGTRLDLTPRRPEDVPDDSPLIPEDDWRYASDATVALWHRLVPEPTPDHPAVLTIEADYRNAPAGTVVAAEGEEAWTKVRDRFWETFGIISGYNNYAMADEARQVLRWGRDA